MQLDRTRVTIRERGMLEICDLALAVCRDLSPKLLTMFAVGVIPFAILNRFLVGWVIEDLNGYTFTQYAYLMTLLIYIEAQLATTAATAFLGDAMFLRPPTVRDVLKTLSTLSGRLFFTVGIMRGVFPAIAVVILLRADEFPCVLALSVIAGYAGLIQAVRPYLNEIILLERNPLWSRDKRTITIGRRSAKLHNPNTGELFGQHLALCGLSNLLTIMLIFGSWFVVGTLFSDWAWGPVMLHVIFPACLWAVACYMVVVRYLSYLDLRTRREGWAVELIMRAEANRLQKQMAA